MSARPREVDFLIRQVKADLEERGIEIGASKLVRLVRRYLRYRGLDEWSRDLSEADQWAAPHIQSAARYRQSVHVVSAGLPTLGKGSR